MGFKKPSINLSSQYHWTVYLTAKRHRLKSWRSVVVDYDTIMRPLITISAKVPELARRRLREGILAQEKLVTAIF
jgi:hypothetical protein